MRYRFFFGLAVIAILAHAGFGDIETIRFKSPSLEGNPLGNSSTRVTSVYLPPSYDEGGGAFPVIYFLHGAFGDHAQWSVLGSMIEPLIIAGDMPPVIIVFPNGDSIHGGSMYVNSELNGNYEDFIVFELVDFIDTNYRTIKNRNGRAIAGHSMGGYGAMYLAMQHPDVYSAVYSHSGILHFEEFMLPLTAEILSENPDVMKGPDHDPMSNTNSAYMYGAAFTPNLDNPPYFVDLWFDYPSGDLREDVWERFLEFDPLSLVPKKEEALRSITTIIFDGGSNDPLIDSSGQANLFHQELESYGIVHDFEVFNGGHYDIPTVLEAMNKLAISTSQTSSVCSWEIYE